MLHQRGSSVCCYLVVVGLCFKSVPCSNWKFGALQTPLTALITKGLGHLCCTLVPVLNAVGFFFPVPLPEPAWAHGLVSPGLPSPRRMCLPLASPRWVFWLRREKIWLISLRPGQHRPEVRGGARGLQHRHRVRAASWGQQRGAGEGCACEDAGLGAP